MSHEFMQYSQKSSWISHENTYEFSNIKSAQIKLVCSYIWKLLNKITCEISRIFMYIVHSPVCFVHESHLLICLSDLFPPTILFLLLSLLFLPFLSPWLFFLVVFHCFLCKYWFTVRWHRYFLVRPSTGHPIFWYIIILRQLNTNKFWIKDWLIDWFSIWLLNFTENFSRFFFCHLKFLLHLSWMEDGGVTHQVDQPKIISAQVSDQKILMLFFLLKICLIRIKSAENFS